MHTVRNNEVQMELAVAAVAAVGGHDSSRYRKSYRYDAVVYLSWIVYPAYFCNRKQQTVIENSSD